MNPMDRAKGRIANNKAMVRQTEAATLAELKQKLNDPRVIGQLTAVVPAHMREAMGPEVMIGVVMTMVQGDTRLRECSPISIMGSMIQCARWGLIPDPALGHCYIVPRRCKTKGEDGVERREMLAQAQIGYRGLILLIDQHSNIRMRSRVIREGDHYEIDEGTEYRIVHRRRLGNQGPVIAAYSVATFPDGRKDFRVLDRPELEKVRKSSEAGDSEWGPWSKWFEQMCEKVVLTRHAKQLPLSTHVLQRIVQQERRDAGALESHYRRGGGGEIEILDVSPPQIAQEAPAEKADPGDAQSEDPAPAERKVNGGEQSTLPLRDQGKCSHPPVARKDGICTVCGLVFQREVPREPGQEG